MKATEMEVVDVVAELAEPRVKEMHEAERVHRDIAYLAPMTYRGMHHAGMFVLEYNLRDKVRPRMQRRGHE
ncbi:hypothetical protein IVA95_28450 [Bradyrhizobium sp. 157]|uniref:hypothetical protein n=1 Tax=Bradyrhizobium sp. 157 TaxID=2782631 RepID=UPI001FF90F05|nr:hypothetical protein [Bradyrhizobium sp. 157]MCK1641385.1 hypothetical protein [Bradyrhizobium sp. 157]